MHRYHEQIAELLIETTSTIMMPRFRGLASDEICEKSPGEILTVVDGLMETALTMALLKIEAEARVIGEESCEAHPEMLDTIGEGAVWIVDPLDGTSNFSKGLSCFGVIIALARNGIVEAGWLYDPVTNRMCHAVDGGGAFVNGQLLDPLETACPERPIAAFATQFLAPEPRTAVEQSAEESFVLVPIPKCAAEHYPRLALGQNNVALFQRTLPWDHAAGALFLTEAGGVVTRWDGSPYRFFDRRNGIVAASDPVAWRAAKDFLVSANAHFDERQSLIPQTA